LSQWEFQSLKHESQADGPGLRLGYNCLFFSNLQEIERLGEALGLPPHPAMNRPEREALHPGHPEAILFIRLKAA